MKKFIFVILALLLVYGTACATNIPTATDPKNYPTVWTELVYNGSGSNITAGYVLEWDFDASDSDAGTVYDDTAPWVKTANSAGDIWTAGVAAETIVNGNVGRMIIHGPAVTYMGSASQCTVNTIAESTASGYVADHDGAGVDEGTLGVCIKASAAGNDIWGDISTSYALIYVSPVQYDKD